MKILVCISHVPDTTSKINFVESNSRFDTTGVQYIINPNDEFGLTRALWLQEKEDAKVTVVNVGTADTEPTLRKALAIGADEAIRIDSPAHDGMYVAQQIASIIKANHYDLIITGRESIDYNGGIVGGALAGLLGLPFVNQCIQLEIDGNTVTLSRETSDGNEKLETKLPLIISAQKGLVEESDLKIPNMRGIMTARQKPLQIIPPIDISQRTSIKKFESPPAKSTIKIIDVDELAELLHNNLKITS